MDLETDSGCRNNYFDGKRLTTDSFRVEQRYFLERRHLLNRAIFGWGVVYGFSVAGGGGKLTIGPGLALDPCGRELLQTGVKEVGFDELLIFDEEGSYEGSRWLLSVHYAERPTGPVQITDSCHCEHREWERTCETVRYSLRRVAYDECCREFQCDLKCECTTEPCCHKSYVRHGRGGCRCLCEYLMQLQPGEESGPLRDIDDPCDGLLRVDERHGVPLACVSLVRDAYGHQTFGEIEPCGPRRLVKRNDLLFDLINGCDLTRIEIGWKDWHRREVHFKHFDEAFGAKGYDKPEYVTRFWVTFSRAVRKHTVLPDCFAVTVLIGEREGGWWTVYRVPVTRVELSPDGRRATVVVDGAWVEDGLRGRRSIFIDTESWVEIEIRGDLIDDCNGQKVDANGNGTPGGTFLSSFRVGARDKGAAS